MSFLAKYGNHMTAMMRLTFSAKSAGVKSYDVSLENQTANVVVDESVQYGTLLEKIKKTGKKVNSAEADGQPMSVE